MALLPGTPTAVEMTTVLARDVTDPADGTLIFAVEDQIISCYDSSLSVIDSTTNRLYVLGWRYYDGSGGFAVQKPYVGVWTIDDLIFHSKYQCPVSGISDISSQNSCLLYTSDAADE